MALTNDTCKAATKIISRTIRQTRPLDKRCVCGGGGGRNEDNSNILFLVNENICCDPSLEPSRRDGSNERSQLMFLRK